MVAWGSAEIILGKEREDMEEKTLQTTYAKGGVLGFAKLGSSASLDLDDIEEEADAKATPGCDGDAQFENDIASFTKFLKDNDNRMPRRFSKAELDAAENKDAANNEHRLGCFLRRMRELQKSTSGETTENIKTSSRQSQG